MELTRSITSWKSSVALQGRSMMFVTNSGIEKSQNNHNICHLLKSYYNPRHCTHCISAIHRSPLKEYQHSHFTEEKTEGQRGYMICQKLKQLVGGGSWDLKPDLSDSEVHNYQPPSLLKQKKHSLGNSNHTLIAWQIKRK